jgi:hypothetical protein
MRKTKENIKREYIRACNDYLYKLLDNWQFYEDDVDAPCNFGWWVGDEVGGVFCLEDDTFIDMNDIRYCVDNDVDYETYTEYLDYITRCDGYGFDKINLNAFVKGAPRISNEQFDRLDKMRQEFHKTINEVKHCSKV